MKFHIALSTAEFVVSWWQWNNRKFPDSPYVFVSESNRYKGEPFKKARPKFLKELCKRAGIKYFGYHALRRYVASVLADSHKLSIKRIQRILRHKSVTTTERYIQNLNDDMRSDLDLLSQPDLHIDLHVHKKKG